MEHDLIRHLRGIALEAFTPIVADRVRKDVARAREIRRADAAAHLGKALEPVFGVLVPEMEAAVAAGGAEGAVLRVEGDGVDAVDVADVALRGRRRAVAFEREVGRGVLVLDVLDGAASFDAADGEPAVVVEARDHAGLPFQRGLHRLVEIGRFVQVDDVDVSVRGGHDEHAVLGVDAVDALLALHRGDGRRLAQVPVFDRLVPGPGHEDGRRLPGNVDEAHTADGLLVGGYLAGGGLVGGEVYHAGCFIGASPHYFGAVLQRGFLVIVVETSGRHECTYFRPATAQNRPFMLECGFPFAGTVRCNFVDADLLVPGCDGEMLRLRRKLDI